MIKMLKIFINTSEIYFGLKSKLKFYFILGYYLFVMVLPYLKSFLLKEE